MRAYKVNYTMSSRKVRNLPQRTEEESSMGVVLGVPKPRASPLLTTKPESVVPNNGQAAAKAKPTTTRRKSAKRMSAKKSAAAATSSSTTAAAKKKKALPRQKTYKRDVTDRRSFKSSLLRMNRTMNDKGTMAQTAVEFLDDTIADLVSKLVAKSRTQMLDAKRKTLLENDVVDSMEALLGKSGLKTGVLAAPNKAFKHIERAK